MLRAERIFAISFRAELRYQALSWVAGKERTSSCHNAESTLLFTSPHSESKFPSMSSPQLSLCGHVHSSFQAVLRTAWCYRLHPKTAEVQDNAQTSLSRPSFSRSSCPASSRASRQSSGVSKRRPPYVLIVLLQYNPFQQKRGPCPQEAVSALHTAHHAQPRRVLGCHRRRGGGPGCFRAGRGAS